MDEGSKRYCVNYRGRTKLIVIRHFEYQNIIQQIKDKFSITDEIIIKVKLPEFESPIDVDGDEDVSLLEESKEIYVQSSYEILTDGSISINTSNTDSNVEIQSIGSPQSSSTSRCETPVVMDKAVIKSSVLDIDTLVDEHPKGNHINNEYQKNGILSPESRISLVTIVTSRLVKQFGFYPNVEQKTAAARGIILKYPTLRDKHSTNGYEHFFSPDGGQTGYIQDKLKNLRRGLPSSAKMKPRLKAPKADKDKLGVSNEDQIPSKRRHLDVSYDEMLSDMEAEELALFCRRTSVDKKDEIMSAMKKSFSHRQKWIQDKCPCAAEVLHNYPRFKDLPLLIDQEFNMIFDEDKCRSLISKWEVHFAPGIMQLAKLSKVARIKELIEEFCGHGGSSDTEVSSDHRSLYTFLILVNLLPSHTTKNNVRCSSLNMVDYFIDFKPVGTNIGEYLTNRVGKLPRTQPYILCLGTRFRPSQYFIIIDQDALPCTGDITTSVDCLIKLHYIFNLHYAKQLHLFYTFLEVCVYEMDTPTSKIPAKIREIERSISAICTT